MFVFIEMIKLTDLTLYCNDEYRDSSELIAGQEESLGYLYYLQERLLVSVIKHTSFEDDKIIHGVPFNFFKGSNRFGYLSMKTVMHLRSNQPEIILLQGLIFPVQVLLIRWLLGKRPVIIAQHHGELPSQGYKGWLQKLADRGINAYFFTSLGNSITWLEEKVIANPEKCYEVLEASTMFVQQDKALSKIKTGLAGEWNFLWVGRLNANKDPGTVLEAFKKYLEVNPLAKLYMIYTTGELLAEMRTFLNGSPQLLKAVYLTGKIEHRHLQDWYSAADFFVSGSYREGSGFALLEAMACGCLPVITDIPTFRKISGNGKHAVLYQAGNSESLLQAFKGLAGMNREIFRDKMLDYFKATLSFKAIADKVWELAQNLRWL